MSRSTANNVSGFTYTTHLLPLHLQTRKQEIVHRFMLLKCDFNSCVQRSKISPQIKLTLLYPGVYFVHSIGVAGRIRRFRTQPEWTQPHFHIFFSFQLNSCMNSPRPIANGWDELNLTTVFRTCSAISKCCKVTMLSMNSGYYFCILAGFNI